MERRAPRSGRVRRRTRVTPRTRAQRPRRTNQARGRNRSQNGPVGTAPETRAALAGQADELAAKLRKRQATVAVIGLGYVGLPLACEFARAGFAVRGIDTDRTK